MDTFLDSAWRSGAPPFDGGTLAPDDLLPIERVAEALRRALTCLAAFPGLADGELRALADWHEHDGYISSSQPCTWKEMEAFVSSAAALYSGRERDEYVRRAYFDTAGRFLLRVWIPEEDDDPDQRPGRWGHFDISSPRNRLATIEEALAGVNVSITDARSYFDNRYAG